MEKDVLRTEMRRLRNSIPQLQKRAFDQIICDRLFLLLKECKSVALYLSLPNEVDLSILVDRLLSLGIVVSSPKWDGSGYVLSRIRSLRPEDLAFGPMKVPESRFCDIVAFEEVDTYVVPGLAFSPTGERIGYGGGWYDRMLLKASPSAFKIGVCYSCQMVQSLPCEDHDIKMDEVVSEQVQGKREEGRGKREECPVP